MSQNHANVTYVCDGPMMARGRATRRSTRRCSLKSEPIALPVRRLASAALPTGEHERLGPNEFHVDPKIAYFPAFRRVKPAQDLAQAITVRDDVHGRPVDRWHLAIVMHRVRGGEEGVQGVLGHTCPILVYEIGAAVGLQSEWDLAPGPHSWRT